MPSGSDVGESVGAPAKRSLFANPSVGLLTTLFAAECLVMSLAELPKSMSANWFLHSDLGSNLTIQRLLDRGLQPTVDFGYIYGLAPIVFARAWFALFGLTPAAYTAAMTVFRLLIAWGLARCAVNLKVGAAGIGLMVCGMALAAPPTQLNFVHAMEGALLCHAMADQACGKRSRALALLTAALFMKPALAYIYGLLLLILIVRAEWSGGLKAIVRALVPAAITGVVMAAVLAALFGPSVLIKTLLPTAGAVIYKLHNYGFFFGRGRGFWMPENAGLRYYLLTPTGTYLAGMIVICFATILALWRLAKLKAGQTDLVAEVVACGGLMKIAFVTLMFADTMSFEYYYDVFIITLAGFAAMGKRASIVVAILAVGVLIGNRWPVNSLVTGWKTTASSQETGGLWATESQRREIVEIRDLVKGHTATFVCSGGCFEVVVPGFAPAENFFIVAGYNSPAELDRKTARIDAAEFLVTPDGPTAPVAVFEEWAEAPAKFAAFEEIGNFKNYHVFKRKGTP